MALGIFKNKLAALKKKMDMLEFLSEGQDSEDALAKASGKGFEAELESEDEEEKPKTELEISIESGSEDDDEEEEMKPKKKGVMRGGFMAAMGDSMKSASAPAKKAMKKKGK